MATFMANEIKVNKYYRERERQRVQQRLSKIVFPLKDKKYRVFEDILSGT